MTVTCPECQAELGQDVAATGKQAERVPGDGDHGFCVYCMTRLVYYLEGGHLAARRMTDAEWEAAPEYAQANLLNAEALAKQIRSAPPKVSGLFDKVNQMGHAVAEVDRAVSEALFRLSQARGLLIEKHGSDSISDELGRILAILEGVLR